MSLMQITKNCLQGGSVHSEKFKSSSFIKFCIMRITFVPYLPHSENRHSRLLQAKVDGPSYRTNFVTSGGLNANFHT